MATAFQSVDEYIDSYSGDTKTRLAEIRHLLRKLLPKAEERISYNMPAFYVNDKLVVYFAGFKNHIGMYPGRTLSSVYNALAAPYAHGKSSTRFAVDQPVPEAIIQAFITTRLAELAHRNE
jgi:uncharacterized protein YdhG (YjbR/CyaY superfamily)